DRLTTDFVQSGFDTRHMLRTICKSRVYQQSLQTSKWNEDDDINYSHAIARRLTAEVLFDSIYRATGSQSKLPGLPAGARAAQLLDSNVEIPGGFFQLFGKPPRESACECERTSGMMLGPVLNLVNGPIVGEAIRDHNNGLAKLVVTEKDDTKVIEGLFLSVLCRMPTQGEIAKGLQALKDGEEEFHRQVAESERYAHDLAEYEKQVPAKQAEWEKKLQDVPVWTVLDPAELKGSGKIVLTKEKDGMIFASGENPTPSVYTITANTNVTGITGIRLEALPDDRLPAKGPGRAPNGNFVLNEFKVTALKVGDKGQPVAVALKNAVADFSQEGWAVAGAIDGNPQTGWAVSPEFGKPHVAIFEIATPIANAEGTTLTFVLDQQYPGKDHSLGKFRLSVTTSKAPFKLDGQPEAIAKILNIELPKRTPEQQAELTKYFRSLDPQLAQLIKVVADHPKPADKRIVGVQDLTWALVNSPEFLFNH
ncbi:MAG TPA: DUF1553 domain-containing protein, partial [Gemmataceae bacterium]